MKIEEPKDGWFFYIVPKIFALIVASAFCFLVYGVAYQASESGIKSTAYKAYTDCLREMKEQPIDVKQTFCGRIRENL